MKKSSETEFTQQNKIHKKTDILDLNKYRAKKAANVKNSKEKTESKKQQQSAPFFKSKVIQMDLYKKKQQTPYTKENSNFIENKETGEEDHSQEKNQQIIDINDYKERKFKRKWKKRYFYKYSSSSWYDFSLFIYAYECHSQFSTRNKLKNSRCRLVSNS